MTTPEWEVVTEDGEQRGWNRGAAWIFRSLHGGYYLVRKPGARWELFPSLANAKAAAGAVQEAPR